jgi:hypothetical protein
MADELSARCIERISSVMSKENIKSLDADEEGTGLGKLSKLEKRGEKGGSEPKDE